MIKKERYISNTDYELLKKLYPNNMDEIIKKNNNNIEVSNDTSIFYASIVCLFKQFTNSFKY